jgi:hypothetical protein
MLSPSLTPSAPPKVPPLPRRRRRRAPIWESGITMVTWRVTAWKKVRARALTRAENHVVAAPQSEVDKPPHFLNIQAACQSVVALLCAVAPMLQSAFSQHAAPTRRTPQETP